MLTTQLKIEFISFIFFFHSLADFVRLCETSKEAYSLILVEFNITSFIFQTMLKCKSRNPKAKLQ